MMARIGDYVGVDDNNNDERKGLESQRKHSKSGKDVVKRSWKVG